MFFTYFRFILITTLFSNIANASDINAIVRLQKNNDTVFILSDHEKIYSFDIDTRVITPINDFGNIKDFCIANKNIYTVKAHNEYRKDFEIFKSDFAKNSLPVSIFRAADKSDTFISLHCINNSPILINTKSIVKISQNQINYLPIIFGEGQKKIWGLHALGPIIKNELYFGVNRGEWGGGLYKINLTNGHIKDIFPAGKNKILHAENVQSIIQSPFNKNCVIFTIGLQHIILQYGGLYQYCGKSISKIYEKEIVFENKENEKNFSFKQTMPFYDLIANGNDLFAAAPDGIYHFYKNKFIKKYEIGKFEDIGGIWANFDHPKFIVLTNSINSRHSLSNAIPILIPKN